MWHFLFLWVSQKLLTLQLSTLQSWNNFLSSHFSKGFSEPGQAVTETGRGRTVTTHGGRRNQLWKCRWGFGCGNLQGSESPETSLEAEPSRIMGGHVLAWHWSLSGTNNTLNNLPNICICIHDIRFSNCPIKHLSVEEMFASSADMVSARPFWRRSSFSWYCYMLFFCRPDLVLLVQRNILLQSHGDCAKLWTVGLG